MKRFFNGDSGGVWSMSDDAKNRNEKTEKTLTRKIREEGACILGSVVFIFSLFLRIKDSLIF